MEAIVELTPAELDEVAGGLGAVLAAAGVEAVKSILSAKWDGPIGQISGNVTAA